MRYDMTDEDYDDEGNLRSWSYKPVRESVTPSGYDGIPVPPRRYQRKCLYCHRRMTLGLCTNDACERNKQ